MCPVCGKTAQGRNRRQNMDNHMLTHTGERPFQCTMCPYRASQQGNLKRHLRAVHKQSMDDPCLNSLSGSVHYSEVGPNLPHHRIQPGGLTSQIQATQNFDSNVSSLPHTLNEQSGTPSQSTHTLRDGEPPFGLHLRLKTEAEPTAQSHPEAGH